jgi:hypothetical protein
MWNFEKLRPEFKPAAANPQFPSPVFWAFESEARDLRGGQGLFHEPALLEPPAKDFFITGNRDGCSYVARRTRSSCKRPFLFKCSFGRE